MSVPDAVAKTVLPPTRWRKIRTWLLLGIAGFLVWQFYQVILGDNFHVVLAGKVYRGAQHDPDELATVAKSYGIRTVINLRGLCNGMDWYRDQLRVVQKLGINQEDICFSAGRMPSRQELRRLIQVLEQTEYPVFLHCRRGSDRTGIACAVVMLLHEGAPLAEARQQLHWRFGHFAVARQAYLDEFLELYEAWLSQRNMAHTPATFRRWASDEYRGGWCTYEVQDLRRLQPAGPVPLGQPIGYQVKLRNTSDRSWNLSPHGRAGFHLGFRVRNAAGMAVLEGKTALMDRTLGPGEILDTTLVVPPQLGPGRYRLMIDMLEEYHGWFFQLGAEPLEEELEIRE